jgi:hypothetical protein
MRKNHEKAFRLIFLAESVLLTALPASALTQSHEPGANGKSNGAALAHSAQAFTFVRVEWQGNTYGFSGRANGPLWAHDYPTAEQNFYTAVNALTDLPLTFENKILTLEDETIFDYPLLYICEVGYWTPGDKEVELLREYLQRGGFLIVDDFRGGYEWNSFVHQLGRIHSNPPQPLAVEHPVFHCFFDFEQLSDHSPYWGMIPEFYGLFDADDRLVGIINYNNDIGDGWEWPETDQEFSTEAFKLGINYLIYAMTH